MPAGTVLLPRSVFCVSFGGTAPLAEAVDFVLEIGVLVGELFICRYELAVRSGKSHAVFHQILERGSLCLGRVGKVV